MNAHNTQNTLTDDNTGELVPDNNIMATIEYDECPNDPRKEFDHASTIVVACKGTRYHFGDEQIERGSMDEFIAQLPKGTVYYEFFEDCRAVAYMTPDVIDKEYGKHHPYKNKRALSLIKAEVDEYQYYLRGEVYYWSAKDSTGEMVDSCGGYYGYDSAVAGVKEAGYKVKD